MADLRVRASSHVLRLAGVYAVLAQEREISLASLMAALAWWAYSEATMTWVYGTSITGSASADAALHELRQAGPAGLCKSEMYALRLARTADALNHDLDLLASLKLAAGTVERRQSGGRGLERWVATEEAKVH